MMTMTRALALLAPATVLGYGNDCDVATAKPPHSTEIQFPASENGGRMLGFRTDPPCGPTSTVVVGLAGGGFPVTHMDEVAAAVAAQGISFIALAWPGTHSGYSFEHFGSPLNNWTTYMTNVAVDYLDPVVDHLRADGHTTKIIGFGWALGNRFMRRYERHTGRFDAVIVVSAGDTFEGGDPYLDAWGAIQDDVSNSVEVRYHAWRKRYFGAMNENKTDVAGGWARAKEACTATYAAFFSAFVNPATLYPADDWTVLNGQKPLLLISGSEDRFAPLHANAYRYVALSPDTVTLVEIEGAGHMVPWEAPDEVAHAAAQWLKATLGTCHCGDYCPSEGEWAAIIAGAAVVGLALLILSVVLARKCCKLCKPKAAKDAAVSPAKTTTQAAAPGAAA